MATRQNQRRKDEEKPEGRAIDRLAQQRGKQLAADKKAQDDAEAAKKAAKPAAQQADKDGKKILAQNDADAVARLPESPRVGDPQRVGGTRVVTQDRIEEKDERRFVRDRDEWNRQKKIQRLEELDRDWRKQQSKSGFGKARFTTTFNGRRARTVGSSGLAAQCRSYSARSSSTVIPESGSYAEIYRALFVVPISSPM